MEDINKCYIVLGVDISATDEEVKNAYINMVKAWHPDKHNNDPKMAIFAQQRMKEINEAYNKIKAFKNNHKYKDTNIENISVKKPIKSSVVNLGGVDKFKNKIGILLAFVTAVIIIWGSIQLRNPPSSYPPPPPPPPSSKESMLTPPLNTSKKEDINKQYVSSKKQKSGVEKANSINSAKIDYYKIGAKKDNVIRIQGMPNKIIKSERSRGIEKVEDSAGVVHFRQLTPVRVEMLYYGRSVLKFEDESLVEYDNEGNNLKIKY